MDSTKLSDYDRAIHAIEFGVDKLNSIVGGGVTFGYIGNCDVNGRNDYRTWMVFLPHPGRVGTHDDHLGGFSTGNAEGAWNTAAQLRGAIIMAGRSK